MPNATKRSGKCVGQTGFTAPIVKVRLSINEAFTINSVIVSDINAKVATGNLTI